jgi:hypothetical protein
MVTNEIEQDDGNLRDCGRVSGCYGNVINVKADVATDVAREQGREQPEGEMVLYPPHHQT